MTYTAILMDCPGITNSDRREAENVFCTALEDALGGHNQAAMAYTDYMLAFLTHQELPLPPEATDAQRAAVARWQAAEQAGEQAAFAGWHRAPDSAYFDIQWSSVQRTA